MDAVYHPSCAMRILSCTSKVRLGFPSELEKGDEEKAKQALKALDMNVKMAKSLMEYSCEWMLWH